MRARILYHYMLSLAYKKNRFSFIANKEKDENSKTQTYRLVLWFVVSSKDHSITYTRESTPPMIIERGLFKTGCRVTTAVELLKRAHKNEKKDNVLFMSATCICST